MYFIVHPDIDTAPTQIPERALAHYAARGWQLAEPEREPFATRPNLPLPTRNASAPAWKTYAVALGVDNGGLSYEDAMAATRDELADKYNPAPAPKATTRTATAASTPQES